MADKASERVNGQAEVGDTVHYSGAGVPTKAYRVLDTRRAGHGGPVIDFVIVEIATGVTETSNLRGPRWSFPNV